jgi:hypothetical protein
MTQLIKLLLHAGKDFVPQFEFFRMGERFFASAQNLGFNLIINATVVFEA